ncbi:hypothetical protein [Streptomyces erythrochromogenes]|uniref:hypothetical protein n=1 Tax=Streptomyces erythrochromogenes TaxID=285574 RepID=UPI0037D8C538
MTPADELRAVAEKLRTLAAEAEADVNTHPYWKSRTAARPDWYANGLRNGFGGPAGELAAALHPGVGAALASLLERAAEHDRAAYVCCDSGPAACTEIVAPALAVARALLGTTDGSPRCRCHNRVGLASEQHENDCPLACDGGPR